MCRWNCRKVGKVKIMINWQFGKIAKFKKLAMLINMGTKVKEGILIDS